MTTPQPTTADVLIDFVSAFFVPMFLAASNGDVALARLAAIQTMDAYRIQHQADLIAVAQVVAFGFATLSSLSLSMDDALSLNMVLRLRGNANACNRSAEANRRALQASHQATDSATAEPDAPSPQAHPPADIAQASRQRPDGASLAPAHPPADTAQPPAPPTTADQQRRALWAAAFAEVAAECAAELPHLPPAEQKLASIRAAALNSSASALLAGGNQPASTPPVMQPPLQPEHSAPAPRT